MPRYFTHYWDNETWEDERASGGEGYHLSEVYSNQFVRRRIQPDDVLYAVTVRRGDLFLLCRFTVQAVEVRPDPDGRWNNTITAQPGTTTPMHFENLVPTDVASQLEFVGSEGVRRLEFTDDGKLDQQTLRAVRQLTPNAAALLDKQIDAYETAMPFEQVRPERSEDTVWVFQFNPHDYDLDGQLAAKQFYEEWWAGQHRMEMRVGERIYFLRTGGSKLAALVAAGRIVSPVYPVTPGSDLFSVDVLFEARIVPPLTREEMRQDALLRSYHPFAHGNVNTNLLLPPDVAARTAELVQDRLQPLSPDMDIGEFQPESQLDSRTRTLAAIVRRQGQPEFRRLLLDAYGNKCAITGCDAIDALEAAHIMPYLGPHTNHVANGLLLRADIHTLFDLGLLYVDTATMTVLLAPSLKVTTYAPLEGTSLRLPVNQAYRPSTDALDRHRRQATGDAGS